MSSNNIIGSSSNKMIDQFITKKILEPKNPDSSSYVRLSENIIDINPVPLFMKTLENTEGINNEFNIIASTLSENNLYVDKNQDPNKDFGIFTAQNAYVPSNNLLTVYSGNMYIELLTKCITSGISEFLYFLYGYDRNFNYNIFNSWVQKYKNGSFLSPHNHLTSVENGIQPPLGKMFSIAYYIDDGDPDTSQTFSGCISFISNNKLIHVRPKSGTLLIWEDSLIHLVNPFFSKSNKERFMLSANILVNFL
jgi:hypothetical protein